MKTSELHGMSDDVLALTLTDTEKHLFQLRFEQGDIYPAYSSLRADPLGTKVFYESLETLPGLSVAAIARARL